MFRLFNRTHASRVAEALNHPEIQAAAELHGWDLVIQLVTMFAPFIPGPIGALVAAVLALLPHANPTAAIAA